MNNTTSVQRIQQCALKLSNAPWEFAKKYVSEIDNYWQHKSAQNPNLFNGTIFVIGEYELSCKSSKSIFSASFFQTNFKSYLYWRECSMSSDIWDGFGSAILKSADGQILLGRQAPGHVNAGLAYLPGGFIDERDVTSSDHIDIDANIARELSEETGCVAANFKRTPGYILTSIGQQISIGVEYQSARSSQQLRKEILQHVATNPEKELIDILFIDPGAYVEVSNLAPFTRVLLEGLTRSKDTNLKT